MYGISKSLVFCTYHSIKGVGVMRAIREYISFLKKWVSEKNKLRILSCLIASLMAYILNIMLPIIQRNIFNQIDGTGKVTQWAVYLLIVGLVLASMKFVESFLKTKVSICIQKDLQLRLITTGVETSNAAIEGRGAGGYLVAIYGDCERISNILAGTPICSAILNIFQALIVLMITLSWTPLLLCIIIPAYIVIIATMIVSSRISKKEFCLFREMLSRINPQILEMLENRTSVLGYMGLIRSVESADQMFSERDKHVVKSNVATEFSGLSISWCALLSQIVFISISAYLVAQSKMGVGDLVALLAYLPLVFSPLTVVKEAYQQLNQFEVLQGRISNNLGRENKGLMTEGSAYEFDKCQIEYMDSGTSRIVFKDFSYSIDTTVGIVGLSGSGKTTLIKTMLGKVAPSLGRCLVGGRESSDISPSFLLTQIRYYPQIPEIFDDDLLFNITFGKQRITREKFAELREQISDELLFWSQNKLPDSIPPRDMLAKLMLDDNVENRRMLFMIVTDPDSREMLVNYLVNLDFYIGHKYDELVEELGLSKLNGRNLGARGSTISGGEKNKIALARFLLPENSYFFILDEPFTNIDILSLKTCLKVFSKFKPSKCGLIVSHNLQVIHSLCEEIIVMEEGSAPVVGRHAELMQNNNLYCTLCKEYSAFNR